NQLLRDKYDGDIFRMIQEVEKRELFDEPLIDWLGGKEIPVSMGVISEKFGESPFLFMQRYLEKIGRQDLADQLKPYHMGHSPNNTWDDIDIVNEVVRKKGDQVVKTKFEGDLYRMIQEAEGKELFNEPLIDRLGDREIPVSMGSIGRKF